MREKVTSCWHVYQLNTPSPAVCSSFPVKFSLQLIESKGQNSLIKNNIFKRSWKSIYSKCLQFGCFDHVFLGVWEREEETKFASANVMPATITAPPPQQTSIFSHSSARQPIRKQTGSGNTWSEWRLWQPPRAAVVCCNHAATGQHGASDVAMEHVVAMTSQPSAEINTTLMIIVLLKLVGLTPPSSHSHPSNPPVTRVLMLKFSQVFISLLITSSICRCHGFDCLQLEILFCWWTSFYLLPVLFAYLSGELSKMIISLAMFWVHAHWTFYLHCPCISTLFIV